jgi:hypothetical protein
VLNLIPQPISADSIEPRCGKQQLFIDQLIKINKIGAQNGTANDRSFGLKRYLMKNSIEQSLFHYGPGFIL